MKSVSVNRFMGLEGVNPGRRGGDVKGVLFDFDGTLTRPGALDFPAIKAKLGCPAAEPILEYLKIQAPGRQERLRGILEEIERKAAEASVPNHGAERCLVILKEVGLILGVFTRNSLDSVRRALRKFGRTSMEDFEVIITRETSRPKPHPDGVYLAAKKMGIQTSQLMVVGDFRFDVMAARAAGAQAVFLTNGQDPLPGPADPPPDYTIAYLGDLLRLGPFENRRLP